MRPGKGAKGVKGVVKKERESVRVRGKRGKERETETSIALLKNNMRNIVQSTNTRRENF
jgi:hypothetical protein